jgi:TetR/AcrR family transcriptional repressor of uid operon
MRSRDPHLNSARREAILSAASDCFVTRGFHATSMKEICAEAGMSPGTLYHYVRSKSEIIAAIIEQERRETAELLAGIADAPDILAALLAALDGIADDLTDRDLILHTEVASEILRQPDLKAIAIDADRQAEARVAAVLVLGQEKGQIDIHLDPLQAAGVILALADGAMSHAALHGPEAFRARLPALRQALQRMLETPAELR